jgi:hypothetical protein
VAANISSQTCNVPAHDGRNLLIVITVVFGAVALISVILRYIARPPFTEQFGIDDGVIFFAIVSSES